MSCYSLKAAKDCAADRMQTARDNGEPELAVFWREVLVNLIGRTP